MSRIAQLAVSAAFGAFAYWAIGLMMGPRSVYDTAKLKCQFTASDRGRSVAVPFSQAYFAVIDLEADLTRERKKTSKGLWNAQGEAKFNGVSQNMTGAVFESQKGSIQGLFLYRDGLKDQADDLNIATLNRDGLLDWNERDAFIYFGTGKPQQENRFSYRCGITRLN